MITFVTGGQACGKSTYAQMRAEEHNGVRVYIATARIYDEEIKIKVQKHIDERGGRFTTIEESLDLNGAIDKAMESNPSVILIDCITMWITNALLDEGEDGVERRVDEFIEKLKTFTGHKTDIVIVTNEVGFGIIPANELSRQYVRLLGNANKKIAKVSDEVFLMVSGIEVKIK